KIRLIAPYCGGAFGGKDGLTVQSLLALAALTCPGRPIKMWWDREESFLASSKRHPVHLHYRLGAKKDGTFQTLEAQLYYDTGPYDHLGGAVMALGLEHAGGPYRIPRVRLQSWAVYTNNPLAGAFRGFGVPQVTAAMEQMVDLMAAKLGISPLEIRIRNAIREGDSNPIGVTLTGSTGLGQCLERIKGHPLWKEKDAWKSGAGRFKRRGMGIASAMHGMGYGPVIPDVARAKIELTSEGTFRIYSGVVDMGQGNVNTYLQMAGALLNQEGTVFEMVLPDTDLTLPCGSASASRTTYTFGNALIAAVQTLKETLLQQAALVLRVDNQEELGLLPGRVDHGPTGREIALSDLARSLEDSQRVITSQFQAPTCQETPTQDQNLRLHGIPHLIFSYGAHLAMVEVDELTGLVDVSHYLSVTDCGLVINPGIYAQQMQGAIAQGLGYALYEDFKVEQGRVQTPDLATYIIPTALDVPDMEIVAVEIPEPSGPFGLKGAGEIAIDGPLPAISNAVADAIGKRIFCSPLTAERVLSA
ncbi:MAG: carbon monoxide dehydrogenase, partial [Desulfobacca sp.]|nr:carbon monoxide dehydrogenase [Desulfobacca sp.]